MRYVRCRRSIYEVGDWTGLREIVLRSQGLHGSRDTGSEAVSQFVLPHLANLQRQHIIIKKFLIT